jgi:endogenous inhibitor of DNA gyrase (YacG/DUF329 family)
LDTHFRQLKSIKRYHHFYVTYEHPGTIFLKEFEDSPEEEVEIRTDSWKPSCTDLPPPINPSGLSNSRKWYLYEKIRPFCSPECQDLVCLRPALAKNTGTSSQSKRSRQIDQD